MKAIVLVCTFALVVIFNTQAQTWTQTTSLPGTARAQAAGFSIGSLGYMGTGQDGGGNYYNDFWQYDPASNNWIQKASLGSAGRAGAASFSLGTTGYVFGGINDAASYLNDTWSYNSTSDNWSQLSPAQAPA